jgi:DNA-binding CsgD family transcriptional regulator
MITGESLRILRQLKGNRTQKEISKKMNISQAGLLQMGETQNRK